MEGEHNIYWAWPAGRDADEDNPKAQTWLDRTALLWKIEGVAMEDGWVVGGSQNGQDSLIGNLLPAASLDAGMKLVDTFACYPGLHMLHEIATQGGGPLIPVWNVPGWDIVSPLAAIKAGLPAAAGRLRDGAVSDSAG